MKRKEKLDDRKKMNLLKKIIMCGVGLVILELVLMAIIFVYREFNIDYVDGLNDVEIIDDGYIAVGSSNFSNSRYVSKKTYNHTIVETGKNEEIIALQAKIVKYDSDQNIIWEKTYDCDYDSEFFSVLPVSDGYIAVGSYVYEYEQIDLNTRDGLIVKYDTDGNVVWESNYQVLGDTEFYDVIETDDGYVAVGQSIYENMELGNHTTGGGVIVKYNKENGKVLARNSYGGNKSGLFNKVLEVEDGYIVCGRDAANYGVVIKYSKDFDRGIKDLGAISEKIIWNRTFSNTDEAGFTDMFINGDKIYLSGAVNVSDLKDEEGNTIFQYDAGIVVYNTKGDYLNKYSFGGTGFDRYNSMLLDDDKIIVVGSSMSSDIEIDGYPDGESQNAILMIYNLDGELLEKNYYGGQKKDLFSKVVKEDDKYLVVGTSNSKLGLLGHDYKVLWMHYNNKLENID